MSALEDTNDNDLTQEQQEAFTCIKQGYNVFITGQGGTGKSFFIKRVVKHLKDNYKKFNVVALTGCAAVLLNCGAKTLHSWGKLGIAKGDNGYIAGQINSAFVRKKPWLTTNVLIVDEVSMMSKKLFELIELTSRKCRNNERPFGGMQVIFCGDFFQLPPVPEYNVPDTAKFCFESDIFDYIFPKKLQFTKIFRQTDALYTNILNDVRIGKISDENIEILNKRKEIEFDPESHFRPTILYPIKSKVIEINNNSINKLKTESKNFEQIRRLIPKTELTPIEIEVMKNVSKERIKYEFEYLETNTRCDSNIELKVGAQVMCIVNLDFNEEPENPICNGSQGIITKFSEQGMPTIKFYNGRELTIGLYEWKSETLPAVTIQQLPLIHSWAVTIHKAQGISLEIAQIDIGSDIFECGQTYVALSRVVSLDGLYLKSFDPKKIKVSKRVLRFYNQYYNTNYDVPKSNTKKDTKKNSKTNTKTNSKMKTNTNKTENKKISKSQLMTECLLD